MEITLKLTIELNGEITEDEVRKRLLDWWTPQMCIKIGDDDEFDVWIESMEVVC